MIFIERTVRGLPLTNLRLKSFLTNLLVQIAKTIFKLNVWNTFQFGLGWAILPSNIQVNFVNKLQSTLIVKGSEVRLSEPNSAKDL